MKKIILALLVTTSSLVTSQVFAEVGLAGPSLGLQAGIANLDNTTIDYDFIDIGFDARVIASRTGPFIGLRGGYHWVNCSAIYGVLAEYSLGNVHTDDDYNYTNSPDYKAGSKVNGLGSLRARVGLTSGPLAVLASAGLALANIKDSFDPLPGGSITVNSSNTTGIQLSKTKTGYAIGLSGEYAMDEHSSLSLDVSRYVFGTEKHIVYSNQHIVGTPYQYGFANKLHTVMLAYNYKF